MFGKNVTNMKNYVAMAIIQMIIQIQPLASMFAWMIMDGLYAHQTFTGAVLTVMMNAHSKITITALTKMVFGNGENVIMDVQAKAA